MTEPDLLTVRDLRVEFRGGEVRAVDGIDFGIKPGRALALVGESGSGKTVTARSLLGLLPSGGRVTSGTARFDGDDLLSMSDRRLRQVRGHTVAMVFQNAMESMNPTVPLGRQLIEHQRWHRVRGRDAAARRAEAALSEVGIDRPADRMRMYPFQLSGGMRQRAMIAMAMVTDPRLVIADEPTTAVDVTLQRQLLDLLAGWKQRGTAILMITHDLGVARYFCDDVTVMYAGRVMESAPMDRFVAAPGHPYSRGLVECSVELGDRGRRLRPIGGAPPDPGHRLDGCPFRPRCPHARLPECARDQLLSPVGTDQFAACWRTTHD